MTDEWGSQRGNKARAERNFIRALAGVNLSTRQGLYVLSHRGNSFGRGSWNNCLFALLTKFISGENAGETSKSAEVTENSHESVANLIRYWDGTADYWSEQEANELLVKCLLEVGITSDSPPWVDKKVRIHAVRVHTSEETRMVEELNAEIEAGVFNSFVEEAEKILCDVI